MEIDSLSYDLEIIVRIKPEHSLLEDFIASRNSLTIGGRLGSDSGNVIVYRKEGNESVPSFEVWGPSRVEIEDLEQVVISLVQPPCWLVQVSVPAGDDITNGEALARHIAHRCKGVVYDPQAGGVVWPKPRAKRQPILPQEEKIRLVNLGWYLPRSVASLSMARNLL